MKTLGSRAAALALSTILAACGGGGGDGSVSTGGSYFTHDQLASEFVKRVNVDVAGYNLSLVKSTTLQYDYVVVYDRAYNSYDAYWLGNYSVGQNLGSYLKTYESKFYYNLVPQAGNNYRDYVSGTLFEVTQASGKNLDKMQALKSQLAVNKAAASLQEQYGMSESKALDTARFAYKIKTSPAGTYSAKDFDAFSSKLTGGHSITDFQNAYKAGNTSSLNQMVQDAAKETGMGSEGVTKMISEVFMK